jgi:hypothetical protein
MLLLVGSTELAGRNVLHLADRGHESRRRGGSGSRAGRLRRYGARTTAVTAEAITIAGYRANKKLSLGGVWSFPPFHSYPREIRLGERGEPKRKSALRPGGQTGCFRSSHKWMTRLIEEFRFGVVPQVYLTDHLGCTDWSCDFESCVSQRGDCQSADGVL